MRSGRESGSWQHRRTVCVQLAGELLALAGAEAQDLAAATHLELQQSATPSTAGAELCKNALPVGQPGHCSEASLSKISEPAAAKLRLDLRDGHADRLGECALAVLVGIQVDESSKIGEGILLPTAYLVESEAAIRVAELVVRVDRQAHIEALQCLFELPGVAERTA